MRKNRACQQPAAEAQFTSRTSTKGNQQVENVTNLQLGSAKEASKAADLRNLDVLHRLHVQKKLLHWSMTVFQKLRFCSSKGL